MSYVFLTELPNAGLTAGNTLLLALGVAICVTANVKLTTT